MLPFESAPLLAVISNETLAQELKELLAGTGFAVEFSSTAEEAIMMGEALIPMFVLVDVALDGNPYELARRARASKVLKNMPIILLSDRNDRDARAMALSAGFDDFIEKPFDGLELLARLRTLSRLDTSRLMLEDLNRFSWMAEHAFDGYLMLDRSGNIHYSNERAQSLLNLPDDFIGLPLVQVVERYYVVEPEDVWNHWLDDPEPCFLVQPESTTARANWVVLEALDSMIANEHYRFVRLRDVTDRMSIYHDMRRFHTVVSHKLRTPMSIMYTNVSLIKNRLDQLSVDEVKDFARDAIGGADRLVSQVRDILTYIDAPLSLNFGEPILLSEFPEKVHAVAKTLDLKDIVLSMPRHLEQESLSMTSDAVEMILHELMENARKFHPERAPRIEISVGQTEPGFINMRVVNDGEMLSAEQLRWAWLPYFQGEKDFTGELPGMGLGFPMVATLVWQAGGSIRLRNRPDSMGVIVDMTIPLEQTMSQVERSAARYGEE